MGNVVTNYFMMSLSQKLGRWVGGQARWQSSSLLLSTHTEHDSKCSHFQSISKDWPIVVRALCLFTFPSIQRRRRQTSLRDMNLVVISPKKTLLQSMIHDSQHRLYVFCGCWFMLHMFRGSFNNFSFPTVPTVRKGTLVSCCLHYYPCRSWPSNYHFAFLFAMWHFSR